MLVASLITLLFQQFPAVGTVIDLRLMVGTPVWLQFLILLITFDFLQWCIHNLLHRIPMLWEFHKVHHSVQSMDWIGNWRFHCFEVFFYQLLLYPFAVALHFDMKAMFGFALVSTFAGHFSHANIQVNLGWFRYLVNTPQMHAWHHTHPDSGPIDKNFGITLSVWDWLFRTAYMPAGQFPASLGFVGVEQYPRNPFGQLMVPFSNPFHRIIATIKKCAHPFSS